jgi:hypothetical protein
MAIIPKFSARNTRSVDADFALSVAPAAVRLLTQPEFEVNVDFLSIGGFLQAGIAVPATPGFKEIKGTRTIGGSAFWRAGDLDRIVEADRDPKELYEGIATVLEFKSQLAQGF